MKADYWRLWEEYDLDNNPKTRREVRFSAHALLNFMHFLLTIACVLRTLCSRSLDLLTFAVTLCDVPHFCSLLPQVMRGGSSFDDDVHGMFMQQQDRMQLFDMHKPVRCLLVFPTFSLCLPRVVS